MTAVLEDHPVAEPGDPQALFEEARRRRRRRWWTSVAAAAVITSGALGAALVTGGAPPGGRGKGSPPPPAWAGAAGVRAPRSPTPRAPGAIEAFVLQVGVIGGGTSGLKAGWAVNGRGLYLTTDGGQRWRNITPPLIANQEAGDRIGRPVGVNPSDLWVPVHDVIGLVPQSASVDGSTRGEGIERTTDGGVTWHLATLPGCRQTCGGDIGLSFVDPRNGFALVGPSNTPTQHLFATTDGGATWVPISSPSFHGDNAGILFTTSRLGWAVTEPTVGRYALSGARVRDPGGTVYHSIDGGRTWSVTRSLPGAQHYELPTFFGSAAGVILGQSTGRRTLGRATVFVTRDGGTTWRAHRAPRDPSLGRYLRLDLGVPAPPLSVVTLEHWALFVGPALYITTDGGGSWRRVVTEPRWSPGAVLTLKFGSVRDGWVQAYVPDCQPMAGVGPCTPVSAPILMSTADGGRHWRALAYWNLSGP